MPKIRIAAPETPPAKKVLRKKYQNYCAMHVFAIFSFLPYRIIILK